jgi:hypothetical protein
VEHMETPTDLASDGSFSNQTCRFQGTRGNGDNISQ